MSAPCGYTIRKVPERWFSRFTKEINFALFDPAGQYVAGSWNPENLRRLRDQLNDAYALGYTTGRLSAKGLLERPKGQARTQFEILRSLPLVTDEGQYRQWYWRDKAGRLRRF